ncbi:MAG: hypothetical protein WCP73_10465, partial [Eubacteriales bacterium]
AGFYLYINKERRAYLLGALAFGILGVLNNSQLGLACLGALVTAVGTAWFRNAPDFDRKLAPAVLATALLGGYIGLGHPFWNAGTLNQYYLMGLSSLPTSAGREIILLIVCGFADILVWRRMEKGQDRFKFVVLLLLLYSQGALLYSLWGSTMTHYLALATIHVTTVVALLKMELEHSSLSATKREIIVFLAFVCSLPLLVYGAWVYTASQQEYEWAFKQHENYEWKLERAHFVSSMNPKVFEDSADLIRKYSTTPAIHILSKYDAILPFVAKKYSAMPFFEMSKFFVSPRELALSVEKIRQDRPDYLFVDTNISYDFTVDVVDPRAFRAHYMNHLQGLSVMRAKQLELLKQVFEAVQDDYELV